MCFVRKTELLRDVTVFYCSLEMKGKYYIWSLTN